MDSLYLILFTKIASTEGFVVSALLVFLVLFNQGKKKESILYSLITICHLISVVALKNLFSVPRPPDRLIEVTGYALPSGHAAGSAFLALSIVFLSRNTPKPFCYIIWIAVVVIALLIGYSRIQLGVHTPFQVLAGFLVGVWWIVVFLTLRKSFR